MTKLSPSGRIALPFFLLLSLPSVFAQTNLLKNPGFEQVSAGLPASWSIDNRTSGGTASLSTSGKRSGAYALALSWTPSTSTSGQLTPQLGAGQSMAAASLLGQTLYISGWLSAGNNATAVLSVLAYRGDGRVYFVQMRQGATSVPVKVKDKLAIPNDPMVSFVVVLCQMEGVGAVSFDDLSVTLTQPAGWTESTSTTSGSNGMSAQVTVDAARTMRNVPKTLYGQNLEWIWGGNGVWDLAMNRPSPTLAAMTQDLGSTLVRFPGGLLADYYDWRKAVGPLANRPMMETLPGSEAQKPFFGTDEALQYASAAGAELLITVNVGTGTAQMASEWVRHVNQNGLKVRYWEIGNEIYGKGSAVFDTIALGPDQYAQKLVEFSRAMKAVDPRIKVGAVACESLLTLDCLSYPGWTETVLRVAGNDIDFLAAHNAYAPGVEHDTATSTTEVYKALLASPQAIRRSLAQLARKVETFAPTRAGVIKIAVTEWGPYFASSAGSRFVEHGKTMGSAVYAASVMKVFLESPTMEIANAFQLVDGLFTGWIGKRNDQYVPKAPYYVLRQFAKSFNSAIVSSSSTSPTFATSSIGNVPASTGVPYVEAIAGRSSDGRTVSVALWNKHLTSPISVDCTISNFSADSTVSTWTLAGTAPDSHFGTQPLPGLYVVPQATMEGKSAFQSGTSSTVSAVTGTATLRSGIVNVDLPPASVMMLTIRGR